jgi:hypothetical protein
VHGMLLIQGGPELDLVCFQQDMSTLHTHGLHLAAATLRTPPASTKQNSTCQACRQVSQGALVIQPRFSDMHSFHSCQRHTPSLFLHTSSHTWRPSSFSDSMMNEMRSESWEVVRGPAEEGTGRRSTKWSWKRTGQMKCAPG